MVGKGLKEKIYHQRKRILIAVLLALCPLLTCVVRCALDGKTILDIYLPSSQWNDELFYYKLTENVVHYGFPQGYFGFNESHGIYLSFAAWSPLLLFFWVIWGLLFGWNLLSPILCNIVIMMLAMLLFGLMVKPTWKQSAGIGILFAAFTPVTRYMLSGMPEIECFVLLLLFFAVALYHEQHEIERHSGKRIVLLFILAMLLTWMRPYYILLFFTPFWLIKRKYNAKKAILVTGILVALTASIYYAVNHYLSAPYLTELFYTDWLKAYFEKGILGGLKYTLWQLYTSGMSVFGMIRAAATGEGLASGALYIVFYICGIVWFVHIFLGIKQYVRLSKQDNVSEEYDKLKVPLYLQMQLFLLILGFGVADLLMYRLTEGSKHTAGFIFVSLCLIPLAWSKKVEKEKTQATLTQIKHLVLYLAMTLFFIYFFVMKAHIPYDYAIPYVTSERQEDLESLADQLQQNMELTDNGPNYENTVVWALWDSVDGETVTTDFGAFYMIPQGFGINLCDGGFMAAQMGHLQSRYIATTPGGDIEKECQEEGGEMIGECQTLVVYDMNPS